METPRKESPPETLLQVLVFDLDNTLLNSSLEIGVSTYASLSKWLERGRDIILATSRPIRSVRRFIPNELLGQVTIITLNGCVAYEPRGRILQSPGLGEKARQIVNKLEVGPPVHMTLELLGDSFATNKDLSREQLWEIHSATPDMLIDIRDVSYDEVVKIAVDGEGRDLTEDLIWLQGHEQLNPIAALNNTFINVVSKSVDKSSTLTRIIEERDQQLAQIAVFGDDIPDLGMMQSAGLSVAMANADNAIKAVADIVIGHHDDDVIGPYIDGMLN
jgi:Cof subfamily protein (haloacid dehalogenase superfamily)